MKSALLTGLSSIEIQERKKPEIRNPDDVLIRMESVGICGSDIHYYREGGIGDAKISYPYSIGHEGAGTVEETGPGVRTLRPGDRIAIDPAMPCFSCKQCRAGRPHMCENLRFLGCPDQAEGCLSEYIIMPETSCFPIPASVTFDQAVIAEPLTIGLYSVKRSGITGADSAAVLGAGPIGLSVLLTLQYKYGTSVYVSEKIPERMEAACRAGAVWAGNPDEENIPGSLLKQAGGEPDIVFECCGKQEAVNDAVEILRPGGTLVIVGIPSVDTITFDPHLIRRKEISILNIRRQNGCVQETLDLIAEKHIDADVMITHRFPLSEVADAFSLVADYRDGVIKALVEFGNK